MLSSNYLLDEKTAAQRTDATLKLAVKYSINRHDTRLARKFTPADALKQLLSASQALSALVNALHQQTLSYTSMVMESMGKEKPKESDSEINPAYVKAANALLDVMNVSSASQIYEYIHTREFTALLGIYSLRMPHIGGGYVADLKAFIRGFDEYTAINTDSYLFNTLVHDDIIATVTDSELVSLLQQYQPMLVADVITDIYQRSTLSVTLLGDITVDFSFIQQILHHDTDALMQLNRLRATVFADLVLPPRAMLPGKQVFQNEPLDIYQLYQYEESCLFGIENMLLEEFADVLVNNYYKHNDDPRKLNNRSSYYCYLVPSAEYMLIDPEKPNAYSFRFEKFKNDIRQLVASACSLEPAFEKPVVLCGMVNVDNVHYIPYFIRQDNTGVVHVTTVDPSPRTYHPLANNKDQDSKRLMRVKLTRMFHHIFPGCQYDDPEVTQMLRERDCGPNSALTLRDALTSSKTDRPLLVITSDGMKIDTHSLTINHQPVGLNTYNGMYVYSPQLEIDTLANRSALQANLMTLSHVFAVTIRRGMPVTAPRGIMDTYYRDDQIAVTFNLKELVERQQHQDSGEANMSVVHSLLMSTDEGLGLFQAIISNYRDDLEFPSSRELVAYVSNHVQPAELASLVTCHQNSLTVLADAVVALILQEHIPDAISKVFREQVIRTLPHDVELDARTRLDEFLMMHDAVFRKLTIRQSNHIKALLFKEISYAVTQRHIAMHSKVFNDYYRSNHMIYLSKPGIESSRRSLLEEILRSEAPANVHHAIAYLHQHAHAMLNEAIQSQTAAAVDEIIRCTLAYVIPGFDRDFQTVRSLLTLFTNQGVFYPLTIDSIKRYLPEDHPHMLSKKIMGSYLADFSVASLNTGIHQHVSRQLATYIQQAVDAYFSLPRSEIDVTANQNVESLTSLVHEEGLLLQNIELLIDMQGFLDYAGQYTRLQSQDYQHVLVNQPVREHLTNAVKRIYQRRLLDMYRTLADNISEVNDHELRFERLHLANFAVVGSVYDAFVRRFASRPDVTGMIPLVDYLLAASNRPAAIHFRAWYQQHVDNILMDHFHAFSKIADKVAILLVCINDLSLRLTELNVTNVANLLLGLRSQLQDLQNRILSTHLLDGFNAACEQLTMDLNLVHFQMINYLGNASYISGALQVQQYTTIVRPHLCSLLNIDAPCVVTSRDVSLIDARIQAALGRHGQDVTELAPVRPANMFILPRVTVLPDTYRQPLTADLAIQCLGYWYTNYSSAYDKKNPSRWNIGDDKEPLFLHYLVEHINLQGGNVLLTEDQLIHFKKLLTDDTKAHVSDLRAVGATDLIEILRTTLLRTADLTNPNPSNLRFMTVARLLNLGEAMRAAAMPAENLQPHSFDETIHTAHVSSRNLHRRRTLFTGGLFSVDLTYIEKEFLAIQRKHAPEQDFYLDQSDIEVLTELLARRWTELMKSEKDLSQACARYVEKPNRQDSVYIALAEIIAKYYRDIGKAVYVFQLLMPDCPRFAGAAKRQSDMLPPHICLAVGVDSLTIDDIPLVNLIVTASGYALDIDWLINAYEADGKIINPYTSGAFSADELIDIASHHHCHRLVEAIQRNHIPRLTEKSIQMLADYMNGSVFSSGFKGMYNDEQQAQAFDAYTAFNLKIIGLSPAERVALLRETIPGDKDETVESMLKSSRDTCLALRAVNLARVVIAYRGKDHGLTNNELVARALEKRVMRRYFLLTNQRQNTVTDDMSAAEKQLVLHWKMHKEGSRMMSVRK